MNVWVLLFQSENYDLLQGESHLGNCRTGDSDGKTVRFPGVNEVSRTGGLGSRMRMYRNVRSQ